MRNTPMVLRHKSFKINPYKKRRESIEETRNFLHNIFELTDLSFREKAEKSNTFCIHAKSILILCYARRKAYNSEIRMADLKYFRQKMKSFK